MNYLSVSYNRRVLLQDVITMYLLRTILFFLPPFVLITFDHTCHNNCMNILSAQHYIRLQDRLLYIKFVFVHI